MELSKDLISKFVEVTTKKETPKQTETTVYGTVVMYEGREYVKMDGSDLLTPVSKTTSVNDGDRVIVTIKNHTATVTGNTSDPSASSNKVTEIGDQISEFEIIIAHKVVAEEIEAVSGYFESIKAITAKYENADILNAEIDKLYAKYAEAEYLTAKDIEAINIEVERIQGMFADFTDITAEDLEAVNAEFTNLTAYNATFTYVSTEVLEAMKASIKELDVEKLSAEQADLKYANIDFSNIDEAAVEKLFSESGIIKDLIMSDGKVTGELVGVTIKGDLIEGNTVKADKLVVKGSDGLYYKLNIEGGATTSEQVSEEDLQNGLSGSIIVAKSITAEKVAVDDLVAFGATIGGFKLNTNSIYSGVKESVNNTTRGIYMDNDGQMAFGDADNFVKFFKDTDGTYKLAISAETMTFGTDKKNVATAIAEAKRAADNAQSDINELEIGGRNYFSTKLTTLDSIYAIGSFDANNEATIPDYQGKGSFAQCYNLTKPMSYFVGKEVMLSFDIISPNGSTPFIVYNANSEPRYLATFSNITTPINTEWVHQEVKVMVTDRGDSTDYSETMSDKLEFYASNQLGVKIRNIKFEIGNKATDWTAAPEDIDEETASKLEDLNTSINETIDNTKNDIMTDVDDKYATKDEVQTSIEDITLTMEKDRESMTLTFEGLQKTVETLNGETIATFEEWEKYIRFVDGNIVLGQEGNQITLQITNEKISFLQAGNEVAYFSNQKLYITDAEILHSLIIGNFAYIPRSNGSLDFKKVR